MELLYLWIERYNNIINQEFLFSNEFDIKFDIESKKLDILKSNKTKLSIFNDSFLNVTAIIGKNGSGKSSFFSILKEVFIEKRENNKRYVLVTKNNNNDILVIDMFSMGKEKVIVNEKLYDNIPITLINDNNTIMEMINLIAFSNSFSLYENKFVKSKSLDISFNNMLDIRSVKSNEFLLKRYDELKDFFNLQENKEKNEEFEIYKKSLINNILPRNYLYHYDLLNKVKFISKYKNEKNWNFIPQYIEISINKSFFNNYKDVFKNIGLNQCLDKFEYYLFEQNIDLLRIKNSKLFLKNKVLIYFFLFYIIEDQHSYPRDKKLIEFIKQISNDVEIDDLLIKIQNFIISTNNLGSFNLQKKIKEIVLEIDVYFDNINECYESSQNNFYFFIDEKLCFFLETFFEIWKDKDFVFRFGWYGMSAGESALLTLFARIFSFSDFPYNETVWLLIDEGDLYLHPEWQRTFFADIHKYLPLFFKDKKIQLFLTSHSPILISDLPKENIIYLERDKDGLCNVKIKDNISNTFGANIHSLYSDSFFLKGGLIGEFAKEKITNLITEIENAIKEGEIDIPKRDNLTEIINIIGEPLIRNKLLDRLNQIPIQKSDLIKEKENLEKKLEEINKKLSK
jgi:hypothetical protein